MIILDEEWNPGKADQAFGRIDRMGQTEETNVHILRIANSIDSWMVKLNEQKKEIIDGFESSASNVASDLLTAMKNGDII
jgi:SNF2 family DNA or RNA helicase